MIYINNKDYKEYKIDISWGKFSAYCNGEYRKGNAPFITFDLDNKKYIGLELNLSKNMFEELQLNKKTKINKYISDITYEDEEGWLSIITGDYNCFISKINNNSFKIELSVISDEIETLTIKINAIIDLYNS